MIAMWMLETALVAILVGAAGMAADGIAKIYGLPRRWIWIATMATSLLLPVVTLRLPAPGVLPWFNANIDVVALLLDSSVLTEPEASVPTSALAERQKPGGGQLDRFLIVGWITGSVTLLALFMATGWRIRKARRGAVRVRMGGVPALLSDAMGPAVVGVIRPEVLLPRWVADAPAREQRVIAAHEWEHVRARDTLLLSAAAAILVAAPWNLAIWFQHTRLREAIETDCDARLLGQGVDRRAYGDILLRTAGRSTVFPLLSPSLAHNLSTLERRICAMTYRKPEHRGARLATLSLLAGTLLLAACEFAGNRPASSPTEPSVPEIDLSGPVAETAREDRRVMTLAALADSGQWVALESVELDGENRLRATLRQEGEPRTAAEVLRTREVGIVADGQPMVVVDGVHDPNIDLGDLDALKVMDIHSIEVVKGPAAQRIWGEQALHGVISITTKQVAGRAEVTYERRQ
jgi:beta-lactamase regulating signal transducer with metallopeptidase domain